MGRLSAPAEGSTPALAGVAVLLRQQHQRQHQRPWNRFSLAVRGLLHASLHLVLLAACLLGQPRPAAAQAPSGSTSASEAALMSAASSSQCPVTVRYDVDLGREQNSTQVPIFVGFIGVSNNANVTIEDWRLGWNFPFNASIRSEADLFGGAVMLENPGSISPVVQSVGFNASMSPNSPAPFPLQFLATKSKESLEDTDVRFNVAPIEDVMFNNLLCSMVAVPSMNTARNQPQKSNAADAAAPMNATQIQVEYTPIEYAGQPMVNTFSQFLARIRNVKNNATVDLSTVSLQYWLQGPDVVLPYAEMNPANFFVVQCEWATTGCDSINLEILPGYPDVPGAHFLVNISMNSSAGLLLPSGESAVPALFLGKGVDVMDLLVTVTTKQGVAYFNATQDYSFMDTPELQVDINATIIPRRAMPNPHLPGFIKGALVWGALPAPGQNITPMAPAVEDSSLPVGITCEPAGSGPDAGQRYGLSAVYCCTGPDPVSPFIPDEWPPTAAEVPSAFQPIPSHPPPQLQPPAPAPQSSPPNSSTGLGAPAGNQSSSSSSSDGSGGGGSSMAWVAGLAAGLAVAAASLAFLVFRFRRRRRQLKDLERKAFLSDTAMAVMEGGAAAGGGGRGGGLPPRSPQSPRTPRGPQELGEQPDLPTNQRPLMLWPGVPDRHALETSSVRSSPSKDSQHPLLSRGPQSPGRSTLLKFGSGISGVSSAHDNPVFELDGETGTPSASTPRRLVRWDSNNVDHNTGSTGGALSPFKAASRLRSPSPEKDGFLTTELLAILERKAATAPLLLPQPSVQNNGGGPRDQTGNDPSATADLAPWQLRRSKSWDGMLHEPSSLDHIMHLVRGMHRRKTEPQLAAGIPPMTEIPPPVLPNAGPMPDVDLDVDYETEIKPYMGRCLGTGGFGAVYEASWRGRRVAVKKLPQLNPDQPFSEQLYEAMLREIQLASKFNCDRLVRVYGACTRDRYNVCLIMELMEGGNLFQRIYDRNKRRMSYLEILQLAHDMAAGLAYLHPSVVHRDLKPQNVLLDAHGRAKLADFGISRVKDPTKSYLSVTNDNGTPIYMAPEQFNGSRVDEKVDVFALAVILNECYTRRQPWKESSHFFQIILKVAINGERPWVDPDCPDPLRKLITKCWHQDPHMRPSPAEIARLTEFMMQEEVRRWEQLANHQYGGQAGMQRHLAVPDRLPSAAWGGLNRVLCPGLPPAASEPVAEEPVGEAGTGQAAAAAEAEVQSSRSAPPQAGAAAAAAARAGDGKSIGILEVEDSAAADTSISDLIMVTAGNGDWEEVPEDTPTQLAASPLHGAPEQEQHQQPQSPRQLAANMMASAAHVAVHAAGAAAGAAAAGGRRVAALLGADRRPPTPSTQP